MTRIQGSDSSKWDGLIDWVLASTVIKYNISKAAEGSYADPQYVNNKINCFNNGVPFGAYCYFRPEYDPLINARKFIEFAGTDLSVYVCDTETPLIIQSINEIMRMDNESLSTYQLKGLATYPPDVLKLLDYQLNKINTFSMSAQTLWDKVQVFLDEVQRLTGKVPWIYTSPAFASTYLKPPLIAKRYKLWIAHYFVVNPLIPYPWNTISGSRQYELHQDTYKAQFPGFPPDCDSDKTEPTMTMADVINIFGNGGTPPPPPSIPVPIGKIQIDATSYGYINMRSRPTTSGRDIGDIYRNPYSDGPTQLYAFNTTVANGYEWAEIGKNVWVAIGNGLAHWIERY